MHVFWIKRKCGSVDIFLLCVLCVEGEIVSLLWRLLIVHTQYSQNRKSYFMRCIRISLINCYFSAVHCLIPTHRFVVGGLLVARVVPRTLLRMEEDQVQLKENEVFQALTRWWNIVTLGPKRRQSATEADTVTHITRLAIWTWGRWEKVHQRSNMSLPILTQYSEYCYSVFTLTTLGAPLYLKFCKPMRARGRRKINCALNFELQRE